MNKPKPMAFIRRSRLSMYVCIGACAYVLEMGSLYGLRAAGFSPVAAVAFSFWVGFITAFTLQKFITFKSYNRSGSVVVRQLLKYGLLVAWNYLFTLGCVKLLSGRLSVFVIRSLVIGVVTVWNYVLYRLIFAASADRS